MTKTAKQIFEAALDEHGELHVTMEGHTRELEVRTGTYDAEFRVSGSVFTVWAHGTPHDFQYTRILDWYPPETLWAE